LGFFDVIVTHGRALSVSGKGNGYEPPPRGQGFSRSFRRAETGTRKGKIRKAGKRKNGKAFLAARHPVLITCCSCSSGIIFSLSGIRSPAIFTVLPPPASCLPPPASRLRSPFSVSRFPVFHHHVRRLDYRGHTRRGLPAGTGGGGGAPRRLRAGGRPGHVPLFVDGPDRIGDGVPLGCKIPAGTGGLPGSLDWRPPSLRHPRVDCGEGGARVGKILVMGPGHLYTRPVPELA